MHSKLIVVPAGKEFSGTLPDGGKGLTYTSRYAFVGANALGLPAILDGLNDQGLSVGLFYFPGYAKYTDVTDENKSRAIAPQEFGVWALANFATVDEVREAVNSCRRPLPASAARKARSPARISSCKTSPAIARGRAGRRHAQSARCAARRYDQRADL
jgi:penicillin V acylase-like amidase (Ntn superfamily)